jgi:hypothetical protein
VQCCVKQRGEGGVSQQVGERRKEKKKEKGKMKNKKRKRRKGK